MAPFDLVADPTAKPFNAVLGGFQQGIGVQDALRNQQIQDYQFARNRQMQQDLSTIAQSPNPTAQDFARISTQYPELAEHFKNTWGMLNQGQQQVHLDNASQIFAALQAGRPDIAKGILQAKLPAYQNAGMDQEAQGAQTMMDLIDKDPGQAKVASGLLLASALGPDKFAAAFPAIGQEARATEMQPYSLQAKDAETRNINSQIDQRSAQMGLDRDKLMSDMQMKLHELNMQYGQPDAEGRKEINTAALGAATDGQNASRLEDLANRIDSTARATGFAGKAADAWKEATQGLPGFEGKDSVSALKQEFARTANNQALKQIKDSLGGRVTDVDMKVAMGTTPTMNDSPELLTSYLRGNAKLSRLSEATQQAQAEWLSQVRHLGKSPKDVSIMGTTVPAGTTFADFSRDFINKKAQEIANQSQGGTQPIAGRSYMVHANPGAQ